MDMKPLMLLCLTLLSGCAAEITAVMDRAFRTDTFEELRVSASTVVGDRRLILVRPRRIEARDPVVCAESLPDATRSVTTTSSAQLKAGDPAAVSRTELEIKDAFATALLQTFVRTELAEVSRNLSWQVCLAYANGAITEIEYQELMKIIIERSFNAIPQRK